MQMAQSVSRPGFYAIAKQRRHIIMVGLFALRRAPSPVIDRTLQDVAPSAFAAGYGATGRSWGIFCGAFLQRCQPYGLQKNESVFNRVLSVIKKCSR
jgi:hypothetical protein